MPYKNPIKRKEFQKQYYLKNRDKILVRVKKDYFVNLEEKREYGRDYFTKNRAVIIAKQKEYNQKNSLKNIERVKKWASIPGNIEKIRLYKAKWQKTHKAEKNAMTTKRRAIKLQATISTSDMEKIKQFYILAETLTEQMGEKYCVDHVQPLIKGGKHHQDNLQVITLIDNSRKGSKYPFEVANAFYPSQDVQTTVA